ncbi:MAG: hypothetical protein IAE77_03625 [Prosthecobacter sp.]|jgi:hypothetical protein|uniref:hypothetical protein n=1 Tax=Prosthecobacter sp. TaxID=1965333 RepID=UPI0019E7B17E|nr:hypothetical protein [Prosthecobacter sp.]MBE2282534.1 hypothetical protein [Prosthecobacter sp.]
MSYRLLISLEAIEYLERQRPGERRRLRALFMRMTEEPRLFSDFVHIEPDLRRYDVHVAGKHAIYFWDDFADRDLKIIRILRAD